MSTVTKPVVLDETAQRIARALEDKKRAPRIIALDDTELAIGTAIEAVGIPTFVDDVTQYADFGITGKGWYVFAKVFAPCGELVTGTTKAAGAAGYIAVAGNNYIDVAVQFEVAAVSKPVVINWSETAELFVFKATDLAVRNLDYRVTFYVYDSSDFVTWEYALTADAAFVDGTKYFTKDGDVYTAAEVTAGDAVPAYYVTEPVYTLTTDTTFAAGTDYYILQDGSYVRANVTVGDPVAADTYYTQSTAYVQTEDATFAAGTTYYAKVEGEYVAAEVTTGDKIPAYYVHSKVIIEGLIRNVTYRLDETVDCPMEFILPAIEDETHGAWFEIRCRHAGAYSMTLTPQDEDAKIATEHTQKETAGINMINLHYTKVDGVKIWRFMNTHSSIPA